MEEQKDFGLCPQCGMKYSLNNFNGFCIHCGCNINAVLTGQTQVNNTQQVPQQPVVPSQPGIVQTQPVTKQEEKIPGGAVAFLVISILGILIGVPTIIHFGVIWLLFGALSGDSVQYYLILYICLGLVIACIVGLPASIINMILKGRHTKKCILIVVILTIIGLLIPVFLQTTGFNPSNVGLDKASIEEDKIIYQDENYTVKQKEIKYNKNKIEIVLDINPDLKNTYNYIHGRVNNCYISAVNIKKEEDGYYHTVVDKYQLKYYKIEEPKQIDLAIPLNGNKDVTIKTNKATENNQQQLSFEDKGLLYQNKYFKLYYNPSFTYDVDLYIESLVSDKYTVQFKDIDFDTPGYINSVDGFNTDDYTISHYTISSYPCENNLSYLKGEYKILDDRYNVIDSGTINEQFERPKIDKRRCKASE